MPTFVYMTRCDGCGHCVDICPSDIMHIDKTIRRAVNIEPNFCWECYSCVKACPQNAIDVRGYADFAPLGHSVRVLREEEKGTISWKLNLEMVVRKTLHLQSPLNHGAKKFQDLRTQKSLIKQRLIHNFYVLSLMLLTLKLDYQS